MPKSIAFGVIRGKMWIRMNVNVAIAQNKRRGRCIECHKPARVHRRSRSGSQAAHIEHLVANPKCSLSGR
jgi:hypothetical protein